VNLDGTRVCVAGLGVTGPSAARALAARGARVIAVDARHGDRERALAAELQGLGVEVVLGDADQLPEDVELVVTSPGWRPTQPLLAAAAARGVPVWGDVELAWRLRPAGQPWLGVTGTNGKTTTVLMLAAILGAAGHRAVAAGNVGLPVLDAVLADPPYDVLAVELSSFQLHWTSTVALHAGAVLNLAPDHLDWHGSMEQYAADKALVWRGGAVAVVNADDPLVVELAAARAEGPTVAFTLGEPGRCQLGPHDGTLLEAACSADSGTASSASPDSGTAIRATGSGETHRDPAPQRDAAEDVVLAAVDDVRPPAPHNVANALAAAALARSLDHAGLLTVPPEAVRAGLRAVDPGAHRIAHVATVDGVAYVDDSKATNAHAAAASIRAFPHVVWVAGGLAKGGRFDELVAGAVDRLRGAVLLGQDRALVAEALARHAPEIPVVEVVGTDTGAMDDVVRAAAALARPGDTVLLAPACASMDMFRDYAERGDAFAAAARRLPGVRPAS
jgi:UDP-N-acetylmuramoylalanine--D-glutamate ligase